MGQCFNWRRLTPSTSVASAAEESTPMKLQHSPSSADSIWLGVLGERVFALRQTSDSTLYCLLHSTVKDESVSATHAALRIYFQLDESLDELYSLWATGCTRMKEVTECLQGVRVVRQEPYECLISFICSSNNNIKRITLMLDSIRKTYGKYACTVEWVPQANDMPSDCVSIIYACSSGCFVLTNQSKQQNTHTAVDMYIFPKPRNLATASEEDLRLLGMGYRAKFISLSSIYVHEQGEWLEKLRVANLDRLYVQEELMKLSGVGRKVADCVALFSLDQRAAVPVDVHVWDIALRDYPDYASKMSTPAKSLTPVVYEAIGDVFRDRFGSRAGWAHSVLFAAELAEFRKLLPEKMQAEMFLFSEQKRIQKSDAKKSSSAKKVYKQQNNSSPIRVTKKRLVVDNEEEETEIGSYAHKDDNLNIAPTTVTTNKLVKMKEKISTVRAETSSSKKTKGVSPMTE